MWLSVPSKLYNITFKVTFKISNSRTQREFIGFCQKNVEESEIQFFFFMKKFQIRNVKDLGREQGNLVQPAAEWF